MAEALKNIVLIGGGGHCKSCIEVIHSTGKYNIVGILDLPSELGKEILGIKVVGNDDDYSKFHQQGCSFLITVGQIKTAKLRKQIFEKLQSIGAKLETVIASTAYVSEMAKISEGTIIMHHAFVNAGANIGYNCIINTGALIEHDVQIGNHNHISTSAVVNGDVSIGDENFIGSNAVIANGKKVGNAIIIGAGATVTKDLNKEGIYVGNPVSEIEQ